jgi:TPP-dependent indolepyruvate ferredoxin oxidoreductase alpha subunit
LRGMERRIAEERARIEAEYRRVLESSVEFEKRIRARWRQKCLTKNERIAELEARVAELEHLLKGEKMDRKARERKLVALMVNDLGIADVEEAEMARLSGEVRALPDEDLDRMLASRLDLPYPVDTEVLARALQRVEEPARLSESGGFTGAPDMSHGPRPEEREG